ncbi:MAG: sulfatase-like hydrolase/transferase [Pirellulales bacterium]
MNRPASLLRMILLSVLCLAGGFQLSASAADKPNVLFLLVDDLKPSFGTYGDTWVHSPSLDRLAGSGMRFDMAYCNQSVCAPSRNNLLVGGQAACRHAGDASGSQTTKMKPRNIDA